MKGLQKCILISTVWITCEYYYAIITNGVIIMLWKANKSTENSSFNSFLMISKQKGSEI